MCIRKRLIYKIIALFLALVLVVPILVACSGGKDETTTSTIPTTATPATTPTDTVGPKPTPTVTATATPTATTTSEPVKLGVISSWSGPMAVSGSLADQCINVIEQQVKDMGGILGGRQVEFVKGDDGSSLAGDMSAARKLALEDKVDILCFGGFSGATFQAVAQAAEELKIPYISPSEIYDGKTMKYNISMYTAGVMFDRVGNFPIEYLKPKTIAFLAFDDQSQRMQLDGEGGVVGCRERWKAANIDLVYEQYFPVDAMDFSPYLSRIKYLKPDLVIIECNNLGQTITVNKQIMELGGWGDMKVFYAASSSSAQKAVSMPAMLGNYVSVEWMAGSDEPGMKAFEGAFKKTLGREPTSDYAYYYNDLWTGIKAMELAGTNDREKVAQAMRSGNLEWDSAWGPMHIPPDGFGIVSLMVAQVQQGGKLVKVWSR